MRSRPNQIAYYASAILLSSLTVDAATQTITAVAHGAATNYALPVSPPAYHPSRILVKPKRGSSLIASQLADVHAACRARVLSSFPTIGGLQVVELSLDENVKEAVERYGRSGAVEFAEPDYEVRISATPNDPLYLNRTLWALNNTGQNGGVKDADVDAPEGWDVCSQATNIIVAVIDTGIRYTHEDLAGNMWSNPGEIPGNRRDDDGDGYVDDLHGINAITHTGVPMDDHGHGTHVAGTIGAIGNNGVGCVGVAWRVQLMACKFLGKSGAGYTSDAITCIEYARTHGASVMNNSWGGAGYSQALKDAIDRAADAGIIFVAAAGNNGVETDHTFAFYPAGYASVNVVSVAATTRRDDLAWFSNWGLGTVDVGAPGHEIMSTWNTSDSAYSSLSGTSMAAPEVSGVFALMKAQFPGENYLQLLNRVYGSVDPLSALSNKSRTGGRVNLAKALYSASSQPGNDDFANRKVITLSSFSIPGINVDATKEYLEPNHAGDPGGKSIWWTWHPPVAGVATITTAGSTFDTLLAVYTGPTASNLTLIASRTDSPSSGSTNSVTFGAETGEDYQIAVDGLSGASGSVVLNVGLSPRPSNDMFTNRIVVVGSESTVRGSNSLARTETGEPLHGGRTGGHSVWWSWTAVDSEPVSISTKGSDFNTLLAVYAGTAVNNLTPVAANDDDPAENTGTSRVDFGAVAGTVYQIAVDGLDGDTGNITLNTPPFNDHFAHRIPLSGTNYSAIGFNLFATKDPQEPNHAGNPGGRSLWWSWTASSSTSVIISTLGSTFDTLLAVYVGTELGNLSPVVANDDDAFGHTSSLVSFNAVAGTTYQIAVDGKNSAFGQTKLSIGSQYVITDIGAFGDGYDYSVANDINDRNQVVGYCYTPNLLYRAFLWMDGTMIPLGTLGGTESEANAINNYAQVVGWAHNATGRRRGFIWQNGTMVDIGSLSPSSSTEASAVNDVGQVVGFSGSMRAFLWQGDIMTDLSPAGATRSWCSDINEVGQITGQTGDISGVVDPFIWDDGFLHVIQMPTNAISGSGMAINNYGQVGGDFYATGDRAFRWNHGVFEDIGVLPGGYSAKAYGINDAGQIVGQASTRAFLWQDGKMTDLNEYLPPGSGWVLYGATAINQCGQIVGWGTLNGTNRGFVLTPPSPSLPKPFITAPTNSGGFFTTMDVPFAVVLSTAATNVSQMEIREGAMQICLATNAPHVGPLGSYFGTWCHPPAGMHTLTARAIYCSGETTTSEPVTITVSAPPKLDFAFGADRLVLSWPVLPVTSRIETATNLQPPVSWMPMTNPAEILNGINSTTFGVTNCSRFFRLRWP